MRFITTLLSLAAASISTAAVVDKHHAASANTLSSHARGYGPQCLFPADADKLTDAYVRMITKWDDADAKYLSDDKFKDTSDSINILAGIPLGSVTFPSKQAFLDHMHTAPDNLPIQATFKTFSCEYISLIWTVTFGAGKPVRGITILGASKSSSGNWQIKSIDMEMNTMAYLYDIGGSYKMPGQP
ncbi:hypothetical protein B0H66DRAFT_576657 [Apodospora peruviana]|uniref:NTF2-like domain-containing protein n=1 Tax=Apodospora peruviana TaxID=516989 RepID=A0AAE0M2S5_9PEZI|nr:hypothetical protein B0H66DRAFT_576657 [Apodospora peruviana]